MKRSGFEPIFHFQLVPLITVWTPEMKFVRNETEKKTKLY